jgi:hypothetical protein
MYSVDKTQNLKIICLYFNLEYCYVACQCLLCVTYQLRRIRILIVNVVACIKIDENTCIDILAATAIKMTKSNAFRYESIISSVKYLSF